MKQSFGFVSTNAWATTSATKETTMTAAETQLVETEIERVEHWRAEALEKGGFDPVSAVELAARHDVDLHRAIKLIESGCPPDVALRILR
jgi:hypothetical protein